MQMQHVILLHGFCENSSMWDAVINNLQIHNRAYHAIDLPGFGSNNNCVTSIEEMSEFVFGYMDDRNITNATVIGHSMGGYVALEMLSKEPERVEGVGLVHSHAAADSDEKRSNRKKLVEFVERNGTEIFLKQFAQQLIGNVEANQELLQKAFELVKDTTPEAVISASTAMIHRKDHLQTLKTQIPFLWIIGDQDSFMPYKTVLDQAHLCNNATIEVMNGVGHLCMYEAPRKTVQILNAFIDSINLSAE